MEMMAFWLAVVVVSAPRLEVAKAPASIFVAAAVPVPLEVSSRAYWLAPTWRALAVTPTPEALMASTTALSDPLPTETFWAVIDPAVSPPSSMHLQRAAGTRAQRDSGGARAGDVVHGGRGAVEVDDAVGTGDRGTRGEAKRGAAEPP